MSAESLVIKSTISKNTIFTIKITGTESGTAKMQVLFLKKCMKMWMSLWIVLHLFTGKKISEVFPDAKVLLMERDEKSWIDALARMADSISKFRARPWVRKTFIYRFLVGSISPTLLGFGDWMETVFAQNFGPGANLGGHYLDKEYNLAIYRAHNSQVKKTLSNDRLLVFKMGQGWEPICKFLGHKVPNKPFPHANQKGGILDEIYSGQTDMDGRAIINAEIKSRLLKFSLIVCFGVYVWVKFSKVIIDWLG